MLGYFVVFVAGVLVGLILNEINELPCKAEERAEEREEFEAIIDDCGFKGIMWKLINITKGENIEDVWDQRGEIWRSSQAYRMIGMSAVPSFGKSMLYKVIKIKNRNGAKVSICSQEIEPTAESVGRIIRSEMSKRR